MSFVYKFDEKNIKLVEISADNLDALTLKLPIGLYTTFRTFGHGTKAIGLQSHFARLSLQHGEEKELRGAILKAIKAAGNGSEEWKIRVYREVDPISDPLIMVEPFTPIAAELRTNGVRVDLSEERREAPGKKTTSFIKKSMTKRARNLDSGIYESLITVNGCIREGFTSNFFYIMNSCLFTAKQNILKGVTRATILDLAHGLGIIVRFRALKLGELPLISEAFICSSSRGIIPIAELVTSDRTYQWGRGPMTTTLDNAYQDHESSLSEPI